MAVGEPFYKFFAEINRPEIVVAKVEPVPDFFINPAGEEERVLCPGAVSVVFIDLMEGFGNLNPGFAAVLFEGGGCERLIANQILVIQLISLFSYGEGRLQREYKADDN